MNLCEKVGYQKANLFMIRSYDYDMHANAELSGDRILLGKPLIKLHGQHPDEILAVVAHELGHWKESHLIKSSLLDTLYMVVFGIFLQLLTNQPGFLLSFGFHHESYFVSLGLVVWLYTISLDIPIRAFVLNGFARSIELQADTYSVKLGYGIS